MNIFAVISGLQALLLPMACAVGIAGITCVTLSVRSCESGAAAKASLGHYQSALDVTRRNGAAALDGAENACEAVRAADAGHRQRIDALALTSRSATLRAEDAERRADRLVAAASKVPAPAAVPEAPAAPQLESELCQPNQPVAW